VVEKRVAEAEGECPPGCLAVAISLFKRREIAGLNLKSTE
jgi:hypothetical protein